MWVEESEKIEAGDRMGRGVVVAREFGLPPVDHHNLVALQNGYELKF